MLFIQVQLSINNAAGGISSSSSPSRQANAAYLLEATLQPSKAARSNAGFAVVVSMVDAEAASASASA